MTEQEKLDACVEFFKTGAGRYFLSWLREEVEERKINLYENIDFTSADATLHAAKIQGQASGAEQLLEEIESTFTENKL